MRYIHFYGGTGYCGCDFDEYLAVSDDTFDATLDSMAEDFAYDNGESYEHVATGWGNGWENEDEQEDYYQNCWCNWEEISKEEFEEWAG